MVASYFAEFAPLLGIVVALTALDTLVERNAPDQHWISGMLAKSLHGRAANGDNAVPA
jgi:hypothetical protein